MANVSIGQHATVSPFFGIEYQSINLWWINFCGNVLNCGLLKEAAGTFAHPELIRQKENQDTKKRSDGKIAEFPEIGVT